jgi:hypothetical protein
MKKIILLPLFPLCMSVAAQTTGTAFPSPGTGDIVITEIMADPTPSRGLPEREYLEITNRSHDSLTTRGILLIAGSDTAYLTEVVTGPGDRIILCSTGSRNDLLPYGRVMAVKSFPTINDAGELISLRNADGRLIHAVSYGPVFLGDGPRSGGGWSAELNDLDNPFNEPYAWSPSADDSGGTPGRINSVTLTVTDNRCPHVIAVWPVTPDTVAVLFDETVMLNSAPRWLADGEETLPSVSGDHIDRTVYVPLGRLLSQGMVINLMVPEEITDFAGNHTCSGEMKTGLPSDPLPGEVMFNELMPDPPSGSMEYIELYNNSCSPVDLSRLYLAGSGTSPAAAFTSVHRQLLPAGYIALTEAGDDLSRIFPCASADDIFRADRLPSLPNEGGSLILYDRSLEIIDRVTYDEGMHMLFLSGTRGVALEKVSPSLPSDAAGAWHSASGVCNYGTPGARNSLWLEETGMTEEFYLSSTRVSPDGDGFEDVVSVSVFPGGEENVITVTIFNDRGYPVRILADHIASGAGAVFIWDGVSGTGRRLPAGLYMIMAESCSTTGTVKRWKEICAVLYR